MSMEEAKEQFSDACIDAIDQGLGIEGLQTILKEAFNYYYYELA